MNYYYVNLFETFKTNLFKLTALEESIMPYGLCFLGRLVWESSHSVFLIGGSAEPMLFAFT